MCAGWFLLVAATLGEAPSQSPMQLNYQGTLAAADADAQAVCSKPFDLSCWTKPLDAGGTAVYWLLDERGRGEWPWIDRFGAARVDAKGAATGDPPALLYDRPERQGPAGKTPAGKDIVPLLLPITQSDEPLAVDVEWQNDRFRFHVDKPDKRGEARCGKHRSAIPSEPRGPCGSMSKVPCLWP